jgi:acylphosphatase
MTASWHDRDMRRVHVIVTGDVQGVGYRYTMRIIANEVGVSGWVRNRRDGSVEAEIEGEAWQIDQVLAWMAGGPPGSRVDAARVTDAEPLGDPGFRVRRDA